MNKEIESYTRFWIDNRQDILYKGCYITYDETANYIELYKKWNDETWLEDEILFEKNFIEFITNKYFIESIARGRIKQWHWIATVSPWKDWGDAQHNMVNWITEKQAIAIRDNKLQEYITNLKLWN